MVGEVLQMFLFADEVVLIELSNKLNSTAKEIWLKI